MKFNRASSIAIRSSPFEQRKANSQWRTANSPAKVLKFLPAALNHIRTCCQKQDLPDNKWDPIKGTRNKT